MSEKVSKLNLKRDHNYLYFVDKDGDVSRTPRAIHSSEQCSPETVSEPTPPAPIAAQTEKVENVSEAKRYVKEVGEKVARAEQVDAENPQVVTTYGVYLSVERYNRLIEYENNTKTHIKNRSILLNHAADLHEDLSKIAELVGIAKSGDLFNMSELIDAIRKLVVPAEQVDAARVGLVKADNLFGVYCGGNPESVPGIRHWMRNMALFWEGWGRVADFVNRKPATSLKQETQPPTFEEHTKAVGRFLNDLYAIMVDPLAEGEIKVAEMCETLLKVAREQREQIYQMHSPLETPAVIYNCSEPMYLRCVCGETREK